MSANEDLFQQAMNQGHSAAWDQMWDRAVVFYRQALEEFPDHPTALSSLGLALYELQNFEEALICYTRATAVTPDDPISLEKIAQLSERIGNLEQASQASLQAAELHLQKREVGKAIENWIRVTRLDPENLQAHSRLALVYERLGRKPQAVTEFLAVASLMQQSGNLEKAVKAVNRALQVAPESSEAREALKLLRAFQQLPKPARSPGATGPLRMFQVRQLEASKVADRPSEMDPIAAARQKALAVLAGMLFEQIESGLEAETPTRRGLQSIVRGGTGILPLKPVDRTKIMLHLSQAVDMQTRGQSEQAAGELERAMQAGLEHPAAYFDLGLLHFLIGSFESSLRNLQTAVKHADYALGARLLLGQILRTMGRLQEATLEYFEALKLADSQVVPDEWAGELRQLYEPLIEAEAHQSDQEAKARLCDNIASLLLRDDWQTNLIQARQELPAGEAGSPPIPLGEMLTQASSSQIVEAITAIHRLARAGFLRSAMEESYYALQFAPTYLPLHINMGELLLQQDRLPEAIIKFTVIAQTYHARGETTRAIDFFRRIVQLAPMDLAARHRLIDLLIEQGEVPEAIREYMEVADVYYNLADLNLAHKTYSEALRLAQQSNFDRDLRVQILHQIADIDLQSLDWRQALRVYEQICTLHPDDERARGRVIELNLRLGKESQAVTELKKYISYLGSRKQSPKAIKFLEGLVEEIPDQLILRYHLADQYRQTGRIEEAIAQLELVGEKLIEAGNRVGASRVVEAIIALKPNNEVKYQHMLDQLRRQ